MRRFLDVAFSRVVYTLLFVAVQIAVFAVMLVFFRDNFAWFYAICIFISVAVVLHLMYKNGSPEYKIAWLIPIMLLPVFGGLLYLIYGVNRSTKHMQKKLKELDKYYHAALKADEKVLDELKAEDPVAAIQSRYIRRATHTVPTKNTSTKYFPLGEDWFKSLCEELEKAEKFIFMEYFIIEEGVMWDTILDILKRKVKQGVEVRLMYDDFGCMFKIPQNYYKKLRKYGLKVHVFHKFNFIFTPKANNRDHRKICVIDGNVGYTGGLNLADEYMNAKSPYGHWKDTAVMLKGAAVWNFTVMFLSLWDYVNDITEDFDVYAPDISVVENTPDDGYVQPFTDIPLDNDDVGKTVYMNMITKAKRYVYITTPYLVIDYAMMSALCTAAKSGIDVRIVTPYIADHWYVHVVSRSFYDVLVENGVKIYEYSPGFIHAKNFVSDDEYAVIGTINLDYRSLYLHYECAAWMYKSSAVLEMKNDFLEMLPKCNEITTDNIKRKNIFYRIFICILRAFAPML